MAEENQQLSPICLNTSVFPFEHRDTKPHGTCMILAVKSQALFAISPLMVLGVQPRASAHAGQEFNSRALVLLSMVTLGKV